MDQTKMGNKTSVVAHEEDVWTPGGFLDAQGFYVCILIFRIGLNCATSVAAFCAGIVNISTFAQMELKQGVNQNLLILSCSDFTLAIVMILVNIFFLMHWNGLYFIGGVSTMLLELVFMFAINYPMYVSLVVTTVIALVRSLSVVMPLSFRDIVTARRQLVVIAVLGCLALVIPAYTHVSVLTFSREENATEQYASNDQMALLDIFMNSFFYICLFIITASMIFLLFALKKSSSFQSMSVGSDKQSKAAATREAQIVKTVVIILAIFVACNVPLSLLAILRQAIPEFSHTGRYKYEKEVWDMIVGISLNLNVSLNVLAYYFTNSAFRNVIEARFGKSSDTVKMKKGTL